MSTNQQDLLHSIGHEVFDSTSGRSRYKARERSTSWFGSSDLMTSARSALHSLGQMFSSQSASRPLELNYGDVVLRFPTHHEFDFALSSRTETPTSRLPELHELTLFELRRMASDIRKLEHRFVEVLKSAMEHGRSLRILMGTLDAKSFSNDHDWRAVFAALAASPHDGHDPYRRVALAKYMQYLRNRQITIQRIYMTRGTDNAQADAGQPEPVAPAVYDTAIFDLPELGAREQEFDDQWPLPRAESIGINIAGSGAFDLFLAGYPFSMQCGSRPLLVDLNSGEQFPLHRGTNMVGRDPDIDLRVNLDYREVSRKHLVIEILDDRTAAFTDLSSHGTRVPASRVIGARPVYHAQ